MSVQLNTIDLLALPNLDTPATGFVSFGAKTDGLYQKVGTVETKLATLTDINSLQSSAENLLPSVPNWNFDDAICHGEYGYDTGYNYTPSNLIEFYSDGTLSLYLNKPIRDAGKYAISFWYKNNTNRYDYLYLTLNGYSPKNVTNDFITRRTILGVWYRYTASLKPNSFR